MECGGKGAPSAQLRGLMHKHPKLSDTLCLALPQPVGGVARAPLLAATSQPAHYCSDGLASIVCCPRSARSPVSHSVTAAPLAAPRWGESSLQHLPRRLSRHGCSESSDLLL